MLPWLHVGVNASLATSVTKVNSDHHSNIDQHPKSIKLIDESQEQDAVTTETLNNDTLGHTGSYSVPVTPVKPYQSSSKNIDYHHQHPPMLPRRSHSYEHLEELGLAPLASSLPPNHSGSQYGSGGFRFHGNVLASVGSSSDVLGEWVSLEQWVQWVRLRLSSSQLVLTITKFQL